MIAAVLSDAHGHSAELEAAVADASPTADIFLFAGDAFSQYRFSNETVCQLRDLDAKYVLGNHEIAFLGPGGDKARGHPNSDQDLLQYVRERPTRLDLVLDGRRIVLVHASPWSPFDQYLVPGNPVLGRADELDCDLLVIGHSHVGFVQSVGSTSS